MIHPVGTAAAAPLTLAVLGPLLATLHQREVELGGRRQRAVVALLVLARGHQVSTARLLDALWDGSPPPSGAATLQSSISHLRRALEPDRPPRAPSRVLVSRADGYAVPLDAANVDAWEFERLVAQAGGEPDPRARSRLLREALALWRGPALAEYAGAEWADPEARRLEEIREVAREQLLAARLDGGETALVVPELEALLAEAPLREERWRLLALSLYRSHRQGDALATLRDARNHLAEDLGADPGPALRTLEAEVLAQSPALDAPQVVPVAAGSWDGRAAPIQPAQPGPPSRPELVDREVELSELGLCLSSALEGGPRLVMIEGPAGIGKTSLLHQVRADAARAGATVVTARGSQLERDYGFGVVRQLFDPVLAEASTREALLTGAATGARRVLTLPTRRPTPRPRACSRSCTASTG